MSAAASVDTHNASSEGAIERVDLLGTPLSVITVPLALRQLESWVGGPRGRFIVIRDVHGVMRARTDTSLMESHQKADMVTPDGMPLVWAARLAGVRDIERVCGPDLMPAVLEHGLARHWRHFFYGGAPGVAEKLAEAFRNRLPGVLIVGTRSPPFRPLVDNESLQECDAILSARPDFVWVGLGTPKQEIWMARHREMLPGAILVGVGAAFDFHSGRIRRAPRWMQKAGLEWFYRLASEPQRLWYRYLVLGPKFIALVGAQLMARRTHRTPGLK